MANVIPWSYSSLQSFEVCPKRHWLTKISKQVVEGQSAEMAEGNAQHLALERAVKGTASLPGQYAYLQPIVTRIKAATGQKHAEVAFGVTANFQRTGYWDKNVWFRGKIDVAILGKKTGVLIDYKTGKPKDDADQLKLFSAAGFTIWPWMERAKTGYAWIGRDKDTGKTFDSITSQEYKREDAPGIWQEIMPRVKRMEIAQDTNNWPPTPSGLCGWCPVGPSRCEFWKAYKGEHRR